MFFTILKSIGVSIGFVLTFPYLFTTIYNFPEARKFEGNHWYNPYQDIHKTPLKANFHAHSHAWVGLTNGKNSIGEMDEKYKETNFQVTGISNYFNTDQCISNMPSYEHGINLQKSHLLVFGNDNVNFFDFPLFQNSSQQQKIINNLRQKGTLITIAHPSHFGSRNLKDMTQLVGYHFTEILSHYSKSLVHWDKALSTGRLSWLLVNADSHDLSKEPIDQYYTMIFANSANEFKENLQKGNHYGIAVKEINKPNLLQINRFEIIGDSLLEVDFGDSAQKIRVVCNGVKIVDIMDGKGSIKLKKDYSYLRLEVEGKNATLYTNPIIKYNNETGIKLAASQSPKPNIKATIIYRICTAVLLIFLLWILYKYCFIGIYKM
jgi:hypothetical protein